MEEKQLKCQYYSSTATHTVLLELRERPGGPIKENNVLGLVCEVHSINRSFNHWVPTWAFLQMIEKYRRIGIRLNRQYCNINVKRLCKYS